MYMCMYVYIYIYIWCVGNGIRCVGTSIFVPRHEYVVYHTSVTLHSSMWCVTLHTSITLVSH